MIAGIKDILIITNENQVDQFERLLGDGSHLGVNISYKVQDNPNGLPVTITNKFKVSGGYSGNVYNINQATKNGIVYPSADPSIFEIKYPNKDIRGKAV